MFIVERNHQQPNFNLEVTMAIRIFFASQILALIDLGYLTFKHLELKFGQGGSKSLCNINEGLNCDVVNLSPYSTLLGTPLALWGFLANVVLTVVFINAISTSDESSSQKLRKLSLVGALLIAIVSVAMGTISALSLGTFCLFCIFAYILSFISLGAIYKSNQTSNDSSLIKSIQYLFQPAGKTTLILIVLFPLVSWGLGRALIHKMNPLNKSLIEANLNDWKMSHKIEFNTDGALKLKSDLKNPKMTIVEFADFQCIHCKNASPILHNFALSHPEVQFYFLSFPLDGICNEAINRSGDGKSCKMAYAAHCSFKETGSWKLHDWLFEQFTSTKISEIPKKAEDFGSSIDSFKACMNDPATKEFISSQAKQGKDAGVAGTPAIYVNGKLLNYGHSWQVLEAVYKSL